MRQKSAVVLNPLKKREMRGKGSRRMTPHALWWVDLRPWNALQKLNDYDVRFVEL